MDTHKHFEENLVAYLMGELAEQDRSALEAHLKSCSRCAAALAGYRETLAAVDRLPQIEPSPNFTQRVLLAARVARAHAEREAADRDLDRECPPVPMAREVPGWPTRLALFAGKVAAVAAAVAIVMVITGRGIHDDNPPPTSHDTPISMKLPPTGPNIVSPDSELFPPDALEYAETQDFGRPNVDLPQIEDVASAAPSAPTTLPDGPEKLQIMRTESTNSAYAARLDWRKRKEAMRAASADIRTANAIVQGLWWLARHQDSDGKWDAAAYTAHCTKERLCKDLNVTPTLSNEGVTAAAVLAMLGDGNTPNRGKFRQSVARGLDWLQGRQQANGSFGIESPGDRQYLLAHAMATGALAEAYGMTGDPRYRASAQKATEFLIARDVPLPDNPDAGGELAAFATARMVALNAADLARLDVPRQAIQSTAAALAKAASQPTTAYTSPGPATANGSSRVSTGMMALLAPGSETNRSLLLGEVGRLHSDPPDWRKNGQVYWLLGSVIMKKAEPDAYRHWYQALQQTLIRNQRESGHAIGSWVPKDTGSQLGGRVFSTALSIMALEVPYR